jgi:hypothetical protein
LQSQTKREFPADVAAGTNKKIETWNFGANHWNIKRQVGKVKLGDATYKIAARSDRQVH